MQIKKQQMTKEQIWKKSDQKAQKNGSHSNIYWVRVSHLLYRNNPSTKMDPRNLTNGLAHKSMSAIGKTTKKMVLEYNTMKMEISTREAGRIIKGMARELSGSAMPKTNSEGNIQETGKMT